MTTMFGFLGCAVALPAIRPARTTVAIICAAILRTSVMIDPLIVRD
jgi:hypothetical protein